MKCLLVVACASLSIARSGLATPIVADFVDVQYSGKITFSDNTATTAHDCFCLFPLGDPISGTLRIDLRKAIPDIYPNEPDFGAYRFQPDGALGSPSWVSGFAHERQLSGDTVHVQDNNFSGVGDFFSIGDFEQDTLRDRNGGRTVISESIGFATYSFINHVPNFITGDGLVQNFALRGDNLGIGDIQIARQSYDGDGNPIGGLIGGIAQFVVKSLTVRPGTCPAP
jgi:hypothetical protein